MWKTRWKKAGLSAMFASGGNEGDTRKKGKKKNKKKKKRKPSLSLEDQRLAIAAKMKEQGPSKATLKRKAEERAAEDARARAAEAAAVDASLARRRAAEGAWAARFPRASDFVHAAAIDGFAWARVGPRQKLRLMPTFGRAAAALRERRQASAARASLDRRRGDVGCFFYQPASDRICWRRPREAEARTTRVLDLDEAAGAPPSLLYGHPRYDAHTRFADPAVLAEALGWWYRVPETKELVWTLAGNDPAKNLAARRRVKRVVAARDAALAAEGTLHPAAVADAATRYDHIAPEDAIGGREADARFFGTRGAAVRPWPVMTVMANVYGAGHAGATGAQGRAALEKALFGKAGAALYASPSRRYRRFLRRGAAYFLATGGGQDHTRTAEELRAITRGEAPPPTRPVGEGDGEEDPLDELRAMPECAAPLRNALLAPLPDGWDCFVSRVDGAAFYVTGDGQTATWQAPRDAATRAALDELRQARRSCAGDSRLH